MGATIDATIGGMPAQITIMHDDATGRQYVWGRFIAADGLPSLSMDHYPAGIMSPAEEQEFIDAGYFYVEDCAWLEGGPCYSR
jgi:hypothetical protein